MPTKTAEQEAVNGTGPNKLAELRKAFDPKHVGKLPRVTCPDCSKNNCQKHSKARCNVCGNYVSTAHVHLDYVGHAEITDRLLTVDPAWTWEPTGWTPEGTPMITKSASGNELVLWVRLTVCGVTRLGVGSVEPVRFNKPTPEIEKQLISDALRNAAMRFGVALDLWAKSELESSAHAAEQDQSAPSNNDAEAQTPDPEGWTLADEQAWRKTYTERFKKFTDPKVKADAKIDAQNLGLVWTAPIPKAIADAVDELLLEYLTPPTTSPEVETAPRAIHVSDTGERICGGCDQLIGPSGACACPF